MQNLKVLLATDVRLVVQGTRVFAKVKHAVIFKRYYEFFGPLIIFSRLQKCDKIEENYTEITDMVQRLVSFKSLASVFIGRCNGAVSAAIDECGLVIARCPSIAAFRAADCARARGVPVFAEVMGCAWDAYRNHSALGRLVAPYMFLKMRSVVKKADYALYVTNKFLQRRYPCFSESVGVSNVLLPKFDEGALLRQICKIRRMNPQEITLVTAAAANVKYKGQQYVIRALPILESMGIHARYKIVGEGDIGYLKSVAKRCGADDSVEFCGALTQDKVLKIIDESDIYIQPSLQEGLPRAVIEAMSHAALVLGSKTAGIPELLDEGHLFKRKSEKAIAKSVAKLCRESTESKIDLARRNFEVSKEYSQEILDKRRSEYFSKIYLKSGDVKYAHGFEH